jgi:quercetin dioxygenase-like cupin family protein
MLAAYTVRARILTGNCDARCPQSVEADMRTVEAEAAFDPLQTSAVKLFCVARFLIRSLRRQRYTVLNRGRSQEKAMMRFTLLVFMALLGAANRLAAQDQVEVRGVTSVVKIDEVTFGHLSELNGKYRLRASEFTFAPGAYIGGHHHVGPGIRYIISGELTFIEGGQSIVYKAGEYYYETGNLAHSAENKTNLPLRVLVMEIIPKDWSGSAMIAPRSQ